eukprot:Gregarina_sp_Poly_1__6470@NODE_3462_length_1079_cov_1252_804348_g2195_i0_p1_GENE_NODE_3462_length_1079_cov_1252_804348_g2195_i0NODE_3462_length_1079_cov_1252_804348_g2195_i0_p1_ORF_typecomplete_len311_score5_23Dicty_REP/PF05086_12/6_NODE_3462_length_1079_cov_1252_804348_g2195_i0891021
MMNSFFFVAALAFADAQDGTCIAGQDPLGQVQSCLGRCHIYREGEYGACNSYQVTAKDETGPCGDSVQNACISTFNAGWDPTLTNCGNCYYIEMAYEDGTVRSTYVKTIDTNGSETKFEMSQNAWVNLCPYLCLGTGTCGNQPEACPYGTQEVPGMPAPCAVMNAPVTFKRVACDGPGGILPTEAPVVTERPITVSEIVTTPPTTTTTTTTTSKPVTIPVITEKPQTVPEVIPTEPHTTAKSLPPVPTQGNEGSNVSYCQSLVGNAGNPAWDAECKSLCSFYAQQPLHCPAGASGTGLTECVKTKHAYCA